MQSSYGGNSSVQLDSGAPHPVTGCATLPSDVDNTSTMVQSEGVSSSPTIPGEVPNQQGIISNEKSLLLCPADMGSTINIAATRRQQARCQKGSQEPAQAGSAKRMLQLFQF